MPARSIVHLFLHLMVPAGVAYTAFRSRWKNAYIQMMAAMLIDLDHLLSLPIFDPNRCSIGYHPLHSPYAILGYILLAAIPKARLVAIGLLIHIGLDGIDCMWMGWG